MKSETTSVINIFRQLLFFIIFFPICVLYILFRFKYTLTFNLSIEMFLSYHGTGHTLSFFFFFLMPCAVLIRKKNHRLYLYLAVWLGVRDEWVISWHAKCTIIGVPTLPSTTPVRLQQYRLLKSWHPIDYVSICSAPIHSTLNILLLFLVLSSHTCQKGFFKINLIVVFSFP